MYLSTEHLIKLKFCTIIGWKIDDIINKFIQDGANWIHFESETDMVLDFLNKFEKPSASKKCIVKAFTRIIPDFFFSQIINHKKIQTNICTVKINSTNDLLLLWLTASFHILATALACQGCQVYEFIQISVGY